MKTRISRINKNIYLASISNGICELCSEKLPIEEFNDWMRWRKNKFLGIKVKRRYKIARQRIDIDRDHIIPLSKDGLNNRKNQRLTHRTCNRKKGNKLYVPPHTSKTRQA